MTSSSCIDEEALKLYARGLLDDAAAQAVRAHLDGCAACSAIRNASDGDTTVPLGGESSGPAVGSTLGRYRLESLLGQGGMGRVFRARDTVLRRYVALKLLHVDNAEDPERAARLLREARAAAALSHPNAVAVHDVGQIDGVAFIAMELVDGRTLRAIVAKGDATLPQKLRWMRESASALAAAHAVGLIHRDIKPENILVCTDDSIKVLDFGLAKRVGAPPDAPQAAPPSSQGPSSFRTQEGHLVGTPRYMAPEQLLGAPCEQSDQFAWGLVAYELVTGERYEDIDPVPAHELCPEVGPALSAIIHRAVELQVPRRFATMGEVVSALDALVPRPEGSGRLSFPAPGAAPSQPAVATVSVDVYGATIKRPPPRFSRGARVRVTLAVAGAAVAVAAIAGGRSLLRARTPAMPVASATRTDEAVLPAGAAPGGAPLVFLFGVDNRALDPLFDGTVEVLFEGELTRSDVLYPYAGSAMRSFVLEIDPKVSAIDDGTLRAISLRTGRPVTAVHVVVSSHGTGYDLAMSAKDARTGADVLALTLTADGPTAVAGVVARLAAALRMALHDPPADPAPPTCASNSLEADHELVVGRGLMRVGDNESGLHHMSRATELDPTFAWAEGGVANALNNLGHHAESTRMYAQAIAHAGNLSERSRLALIGLEAMTDDDYDPGIEAYETLLRKWPEDTRFLGNLGSLYFLRGNIPKALAASERGAKDHPGRWVSRANLARDQLVSGLLEPAHETARALLADAPHPSTEAYEYEAAASALLGRHDDALAVYDALAATDASRAARGRAELLMYEGRFADARALLAPAIVADTAKGERNLAATKQAMLADLSLRTGDRKGAHAAAEAAARSDETVTIYRAANVLLELGDFGEADKIAARIAERAPRIHARLYGALLQADEKRLRGKPREAVAILLETRKTLMDAWLLCVSLGRAYLGDKASSDAVRELSGCQDRRAEGAVALSDELTSLSLMPPALYYLARAKELAGAPDAASAYRAFLALEPAAQHDALAEDARKALYALAGL